VLTQLVHLVKSLTLPMLIQIGFIHKSKNADEINCPFVVQFPQKKSKKEPLVGQIAWRTKLNFAHLQYLNLCFRNLHLINLMYPITSVKLFYQNMPTYKRVLKPFLDNCFWKVFSMFNQRKQFLKSAIKHSLNTFPSR
jgi:hypothetical protein